MDKKVTLSEKSVIELSSTYLPNGCEFTFHNAMRRRVLHLTKFGSARPMIEPLGGDHKEVSIPNFLADKAARGLNITQHSKLLFQAIVPRTDAKKFDML